MKSRLQDWKELSLSKSRKPGAHCGALRQELGARFHSCMGEQRLKFGRQEKLGEGTGWRCQVACTRAMVASGVLTDLVPSQTGALFTFLGLVMDSSAWERAPVGPS